MIQNNQNKKIIKIKKVIKMDFSKINIIIKEINKTIKKNNFKTPSVTFLKIHGATPYLILISTIISLRTKDEVTLPASKRLFELAKTPEEMMKLNEIDIINAIYPAGFYRRKAINIIEVSKEIFEKYNSIVPDEIDELIKLKGVGRKTANLVVSLGYNKPAICVDTHVHRISNRLGYVKTKNPEETEFELRKKLPKKFWNSYNDILVTYGQNICRPISPKCHICNVRNICDYGKIK